METSKFEVEIQRRHAAVRTAVGAADDITLLHIGPEQTGVVVDRKGGRPTVLLLGIGAQRTARDHFRHVPPTPLELEQAIVTVEDEVMRARNLIPRDARLYSTDTAIREIARIAGVPEGAHMRLTLEAMECSFDRLAAISLGRPAASDGLPTDSGFAATLLILREFMHHMAFASITCIHPA